MEGEQNIGVGGSLNIIIILKERVVSQRAE